MAKLPYQFYQKEEVTELAIQLLGKQLFTNIDGVVTGGTIVETEAYSGVVDKASHAYNGRFTPRTATMYEAGGVAYIYLCYGIHSLFNVVTAPKGTPHAVLIRGIVPTVGINAMLNRRKMEVLAPRITAGPGALAQALGITRALNGKDLQGDEIWIEDDGLRYENQQIIAVPRVGVDYAAEHAFLPWRFLVKDNPYVSKPNKFG